MPNYNKMKMADKAEVETREEYNQRRYQETQRSNLNKMEKISPNPLYKQMRDEESEKTRTKSLKEYRGKMKQLKDRRNDPFANG